MWPDTFEVHAIRRDASIRALRRSMMGGMEPTGRTRFPRWVYGSGAEPDPRLSLANERTFLAWIRTSLALLAGGLALEALEVPVEERLRLAASVVLVILGIAAPVQAWVGWARVERAMRTRQPLPAPVLAGPLGLGVLVAGTLLLIGIGAR